MDGWTQTLAMLIAILNDTKVQLILFNRLLNQLQNWILRESVLFFMDPNGPHSSSFFMETNLF